MNGIPPRSKVRDVIMDRTARPLDREAALGMVLEMGYTRILFYSFEAQSWTNDHNVEHSMGFTHTPECAQDHYWRLLCHNKQWYFQFVDYSPRMEASNGS